jgi:hypothetical protein
MNTLLRVFVAVACLWVGMLHAQPKLADTAMVQTAAGTVTSTVALTSLIGSSSTMVLVIDVGGPQALAWLAQLKAVPGEAARKSAIVIVSYPAPQEAAATRLLQAYPDLRMAKDPEMKLFRALKLPGLPMALGISPPNTIAWQQLGTLPGTSSIVPVIEHWVKGSAQAN